MEPKTDLIMSWYWFGITVAAGYLIGLITDYILRRYVKKLADRTAWEGDELIVIALARKMPLWGLMGGILIALPFAPLAHKLVVGLEKGIGVGLVVSVTWVSANIASGLIQVSAGAQLGGASTSIFRVLAKVGVWGLGLTVALHQVGISIAPILTALGVGGLAVALALQDTLSNLFAGINIIMSRQVKVGDFIKLDGGSEGFVEDINWRNTTLRAPANNLIIIPNNKLSTTIVTNHALPEPELLLVIPVSIAYRSNLAEVERITNEVAAETLHRFDAGVPDRPPVIRYNQLGESGIGFSTILRVKDYDSQFLVRHEFLKALMERYREESIEVALPQRVVTMEKLRVESCATAVVPTLRDDESRNSQRI